MFLLSQANSWLMNLIILAMIICLVVLLPIIDYSVCKKLKLNLLHGISNNPKSESLLRIRKIILYLILAAYLSVNVYLVFFSRSESSVYQVNTNFMYDLKHSFKVDIGVFSIIKDIFVQGFNVGFSHIHIEKPEDITQVLANTLLYVPMGYLLPYTIEKLRNKKAITVLICFLVSFLTENFQLVFKRGFYDLDDMFFNTLGGFIGYLLFVAIAFQVTHPNWRKEQKLLLHWKRRAFKKTLFRYYRSIGANRISIIASSEDDIHSFYIDKLGFRLRGLDFSLESEESRMLISLGDAYIDIKCLNRESEIYPQTINLKSKRLDRIKKKLEENDVKTESFEEDVFTHRRILRVEAPDGVTIIFSE